MNWLRYSILKPTAASADKEAVHWSFSSHSDGHCKSFSKGAILLFAPPSSGVYGLFNIDCQLFIGESANIQEALLRHKSESDFQSQHLQPTGFTFEACPAELRRSKADELIARFHPVLQTGAALSESISQPSNGPTVGAAGPDGKDLKTYYQEFPLDERQEQPEFRRHFYFKRTHCNALAAMSVASVVGIFYFGVPASEDIQELKPLPRVTVTQPPVAAGVGAGVRQQNVSSIDTALAKQGGEPTPVKPDVHVSAATPDAPVRLSAQRALATDGAPVQELSELPKASSIAHSAGGDSRKKWSVQISAAPAQDIADTLVQRLKASGYDSYVVHADVKGQSYYRVRVGNFELREEAEAVRQSLMRQGDYGDAYLTGD